MTVARAAPSAPFLLYIKRFSWNTEIGLVIEASLALTLVAMLLRVSFSGEWARWGSALTPVVDFMAPAAPPALRNCGAFDRARDSV